MITLYFEINNIGNLLQIYDGIEIARYTGLYTNPTSPVGDVVDNDDWVTVSGVSPYTAPVVLLNGVTAYYVYDDIGSNTSWYSSRYIKIGDPTTVSNWSTPVLGDATALYTDPMYPSEISLNSSENRIVDRIRLLIGDPYDLRRDYSEEDTTNIQPIGNVYRLNEKGWPIYVNMSGIQYTSLDNPTVNGYRYLKFNRDVSTPVTTSGVTYGIDIWYYTFRYSDREILEAYDNTPVPDGLNTTNANSEAYILNTAIDLVRAELLLDTTEDGAQWADDRSNYNPSPGLEAKRKLLDSLEKKLDKLVKSLKMTKISGVLID